MNAPTCSIDRCERPPYGHGWCDSHWKQWRRTGSPTKRTLHLEDVEFLAETGESFEIAASRLGVLPASLERFLDREKRRDLLAAFRGMAGVA